MCDTTNTSKFIFNKPKRNELQFHEIAQILILFLGQLLINLSMDNFKVNIK